MDVGSSIVREAIKLFPEMDARKQAGCSGSGAGQEIEIPLPGYRIHREVELIGRGTIVLPPYLDVLRRGRI